MNIELSDNQSVLTLLLSTSVMSHCTCRKVEGHVNDALELYRQPLRL